MVEFEISRQFSNLYINFNVISFIVFQDPKSELFEKLKPRFEGKIGLFSRGKVFEDFLKLVSERKATMVANPEMIKSYAVYVLRRTNKCPDFQSSTESASNMFVDIFVSRKFMQPNKGKILKT